MKRLALLLGLVGCANPERELAQCKVVADYTTGVLAACLVSQHDWDPDEAARAGVRYDLHVVAELHRRERAAAAACASFVDSVLSREPRHIRAAVIQKQC